MNINFNNSVTIAEAARMVSAYGAEQTIILQGETGIGKSTVLKLLEQEHGDKYDYIYADCPVMDVSDVGMRIPDHGTKKLEYYLSSLFKMDSPKPKMIMLDEFMKCPKMLQVIWTRLMLEHTIGDISLTDGSIVFATSNNTVDGLGDTMLAHAGNRVMIVQVRKSNHAEFLTLAAEHNISPITRAWVAMNPRCMASYLDGGQDDNPYIFNPKSKQLSFVTPRSLFKVDPVIKKRDAMGASLTQAAIAGTIGAAAAQSLAAFISLANELISIKEVIADPDGVLVPEKPAVLFMMMFNAVDTIKTQDDLSQVMKFVSRIKSAEIQALFFTMAVQNKNTTRLAKNNQQLMVWAKDNYELFI